MINKLFIENPINDLNLKLIEQILCRGHNATNPLAINRKLRNYVDCA